MTAAPFPAASFDVLIDKGGLDALHADDSPTASVVAAAAVAEAVRLTAPGGTYAVVSLCEPHVLAALLAGLRVGGWGVRIAVPPPPPDMAGAALQPLVVLARRAGAGEPPAAASAQPLLPPVECDLPHPIPPFFPNAAQLAGVAGVVATENAARARGEGAQAVDAATPAPAGGDPWAALVPGRVVAAPVGPPPSPPLPPRFTATVVDAPADPPSRTTPPTPSAAVFVIPQGREHEWLFRAPDGLQTLRGQVGVGRLVAVCLGRGHAFHGGLAAIQADLGLAVAHLAPVSLRGVPRAVPILTLGGEAGLGWRRPVARVASALSGLILVEDVAPPDAAAAAAAGIVGFRTLVFGGAAGLVQSEAALVAGDSGGGGGGSKAKAGGVDPKPAAGMPVAGTHLPAAYHTAILAGIALGVPAMVEVRQRAGGGAPPPRALVVGVGGGGLAAHLAAALRFGVATVDLDPAVLAVARAHFGLQAAEDALGGDRLAVAVGDGVAAVGEADPGSLALCVVDAGGGGGEDAMSCPPPPFTTDAFVGAAAAALDPNCGLLVVNCVCRVGGPVEALVEKLKVREKREGEARERKRKMRRARARLERERGALTHRRTHTPFLSHSAPTHAHAGPLPGRPGD